MKLRLSKPGAKSRIFLVCLAAAFIFWFLNALDAPSDRNVVLPVQYDESPVAIRFIDSLPGQVTVWVEGRGLGFLSADLQVVFRNPEISLGNLRSAGLDDTLQLELPVREILKPAAGDFPEEMRIIRTEPESIRIRYTGNFTRRVPVIADADFEFRKQFMLEDRVMVSPDSVDISGTRGALASVSLVRTVKTIVHDLHRHTRVRVDLESPGNRIRLSEKEAILDIPVSEYAEGTVQVPVTMSRIDDRELILLPSQVQLTYRSPVSRFRQISPLDFSVAVEDLSPGKGNRASVSVSREPDQATVTAISPAWVEFFILN